MLDLDEERHKFGVRLATLRMDRGLSQHALGLEVGVSGQSVCAYEHGRMWPSVVVLIRMCEVLDTNPVSILGWDQPKPRYVPVVASDQGYDFMGEDDGAIGHRSGDQT